MILYSLQISLIYHLDEDKCNNNNTYLLNNQTFIPYSLGYQILYLCAALFITVFEIIALIKFNQKFKSRSKAEQQFIKLPFYLYFIFPIIGNSINSVCSFLCLVER